MSRKAVFSHIATPAAAEPASVPRDVELPRGNRHRMRPLLGDPNLLDEGAATPVGAVGRTLGELSVKSQRADEIERQLAMGQNVVELDPASVDPSFVSDRLLESPETHAALVDAIRENGQLVPILVRPHPTSAGRYQIAYGHRRLKAVFALGRSVRAVVRVLSDDELVIAQGQENHERRDLSFIEKARFADQLEKRFGRATTMAAMSIYKSDLSNMLAVIERIPSEVIEAIGAAPGIGRRGWIELAELMRKAGNTERVKAALDDAKADGSAVSSDDRFKSVLDAVKAPPARPTQEVLADGAGRPMGRVQSDERKLVVTVDRRKAPAFADFLAGRLTDLMKEFGAGESRKP